MPASVVLPTTSEVIADSWMGEWLPALCLQHFPPPLLLRSSGVRCCCSSMPVCIAILHSWLMFNREVEWLHGQCPASQSLAGITHCVHIPQGPRHDPQALFFYGRIYIVPPRVTACVKKKSHWSLHALIIQLAQYCSYAPFRGIRLYNELIWALQYRPTGQHLFDMGEVLLQLVVPLGLSFLVWSESDAVNWAKCGRNHR